MYLDLSIISLLLILGFLVGIISVICGIGGGVFFVTFMTLIFLIPIDIAIDTSTFVILIASTAGFITYYRDKRLDIRSTLIFSIFSILGSLSCMLLLQFLEINNYILKVLFASTLLVAGLSMINKALKTKKLQKSQETPIKEFSLKSHDYKSKLNRAIPLFFLAGFIAYLLGVGGGIVNTPSLNIVLDYPIHISTATSTGMIFFTAILNTILKTFYGKIDFIVGIIISIGSLIGSIFGAKISNKIPKMQLQIIVAGVLMLLAIRMYF
ncbi:MAG: sulfite exporter TauE/SafE family protein [Promethearchaeota archaeon]|nr:MAG: sulfite exporter TauE/SafE family protein [Candidatus Lokiarchaeota archaeon]